MSGQTTPKHGGCADCGSRDEEHLTSVARKADDSQPMRGVGKAVCSRCLVNYPEGQP